MTHYVDGFVVPVPLKNLDAYRRAHRTNCPDWACGLPIFADEPEPHGGSGRLAALADFKLPEDRDRINAKVMEDPRMKPMMDPKTMPFDGMRMFWGGFKTLL